MHTTTAQAVQSLIDTGTVAGVNIFSIPGNFCQRIFTTNLLIYSPEAKRANSQIRPSLFRSIVSNRLGNNVLTVSQWVSLINKALPSIKCTCMAQGCPKVLRDYGGHGFMSTLLSSLIHDINTFY